MGNRSRKHHYNLKSTYIRQFYVLGILLGVFHCGIKLLVLIYTGIEVQSNTDHTNFKGLRNNWKNKELIPEKQSSYLKYTLVGLGLIYSENCDCITCRKWWRWWGGLLNALYTSKVQKFTTLFLHSECLPVWIFSKFLLPSSLAPTHTHLVVSV